MALPEQRDSPSSSPLTVGSGERARLDPGQVQFVFADFQKTLLPRSATADPAHVTRAAMGMADVAGLLDIPMWFSVADQDGTDPTLVEPLQPYADDANTLGRVTPGAFMDAATLAALADTGRPILVVAGFASEVVVMQTVLDGLAEGYTVYYAVDAIGGLSERSEQAVFRAMDAAGARPTSVVSLAARLAPDFSRSPGTEVLAVMMSLIEAR